MMIAQPTGLARAAGTGGLAEVYLSVRERTESLASPLSAEDQLLQSMPEASPTKWHRAHTTWFFETFLLAPCGAPPFDTRYGPLFNSYYEALGTRHPRPRRGMLSRPSMEEVARYRAAIDAQMVTTLRADDGARSGRFEFLVRLGLAHEEQHQELLLTDILHALSQNPLRPAYRDEAGARIEMAAGTASRDDAELRFVAFEGGLSRIGGREGEAFVFDNELPRHVRWVEPFGLADRLVTVREMKAFIADGGYRTASLWLSDGWDFVRANDLVAPLYADVRDGAFTVFGFDGVRVPHDSEPVLHVSLYEADAIARYLGARLPTEAEWEVAAERATVEGNFLDSGSLRPGVAPPRHGGVRQLYGDAWEWTRSAYDAYPGYAPSEGAIGEYNGKFMANQFVLRGGSCLTPAGHVRASYRNFWPPGTRFQATGVRLAKDLSKTSARQGDASA